MIREIKLNNREIKYDLTVKRVKNINLRIKQDGTISVSANRFVSQKEIDKFLLSREKLILNALEKIERIMNRGHIKYFNESEIRVLVLELCKQVYPYYEAKGIEYPKIVFRKLKSKWGSCHVVNKQLTFNENLMYAPRECIEYVVYHEFTHFLVPNHSSSFYTELSKVCPDWKSRRKKLNEIIII